DRCSDARRSTALRWAAAPGSRHPRRPATARGNQFSWVRTWPNSCFPAADWRAYRPFGRLYSDPRGNASCASPAIACDPQHFPRERTCSMDFEHSAKVKDLQAKLSEFMDDHIYPNERRWHEEINAGDRWQPTKIVEQLKPIARSA